MLTAAPVLEGVSFDMRELRVIIRTNEPTANCGMIRVLNPIKLQKDGWYAHSTTCAAGLNPRLA